MFFWWESHPPHETPPRKPSQNNIKMPNPYPEIILPSPSYHPSLTCGRLDIFYAQMSSIRSWKHGNLSLLGMTMMTTSTRFFWRMCHRYSYITNFSTSFGFTNLVITLICHWSKIWIYATKIIFFVPAENWILTSRGFDTTIWPTYPHQSEGVANDHLKSW